MRHNLKKSVTAAAATVCVMVSAAHAAVPVSGAKARVDTVTISARKTKGMTCSAGVCTPAKRRAFLNASDLQTMLASSDVTVKANLGSGTIAVVAPITWAGTQRLTLDASASIHVQAAVVVEGPGALTLITNDGGSGDDTVFSAGGYAAFWDLSSSLVINGASFTLVKDIATLASDVAANPSGNFALAGNYDASADGNYNHVPVATVFSGKFEGLGNTISNLSISLPVSNVPLAGLFAQSSGTLRDIALTNIRYSAPDNGNSVYSGALVGENDGTVSHASATGTVYGDLARGGLVGKNKGTIADSSVGVGGAIGGLVDENYGAITRSFATGSTFGYDTGGLVYFNDFSGTITQCYATGNVTGTTSWSGYGHAGGLVAVAYGTIAQSFATGIVTAADGKMTTAGGLISYMGSGALVSQSYATGRVIGGKKSEIGGFAGEVAPAATIQQSYSTGAVTIGKSALAGGALGYDASAGQKISALYWNLDASGIADSTRGADSPRNDPGITGLTDAQLKTALPAGFDPNVWGQNASINNGWPYLLANPSPQ